MSTIALKRHPQRQSPSVARVASARNVAVDKGAATDGQADAAAEQRGFSANGVSAEAGADGDGLLRRPGFRADGDQPLRTDTRVCSCQVSVDRDRGVSYDASAARGQRETSAGMALQRKRISSLSER